MTPERLDRMGCDGFLAERTCGYAALYPVLREAARQKGYALALHGTLQKDLDVIAIPWTEEAVPEEELVQALVDACGGSAPADRRYYNVKAHGRLAVTVFLQGRAGYIDLSVMPRQVLP